MCDEVMQIMVKWTIASILLSLVLGTAAWWVKADIPPFLATIPASGFTLLGAMWQVKHVIPSDSPVKQDEEGD